MKAGAINSLQTRGRSMENPKSEPPAAQTVQSSPSNGDRQNQIDDQQPEVIRGAIAPNPFAVMFKREYNFFVCWYLHLSHNFNAVALDVLYRRLRDTYSSYDAPHDSDDENGGGDYSDKSAESQERRLGAVIDAFIRLKATADLILQHMTWLEDLELESLLAIPELYRRKPNSSLAALMILCSKTRLFVRCILENLRTRNPESAPHGASLQQHNARYRYVDEKFVRTYVPHYLKLEYSQKPRVLKPCTCGVRLDPLNLP